MKIISWVCLSLFINSHPGHCLDALLYTAVTWGSLSRAKESFQMVFHMLIYNPVFKRPANPELNVLLKKVEYFLLLYFICTVKTALQINIFYAHTVTCINHIHFTLHFIHSFICSALLVESNRIDGYGYQNHHFVCRTMSENTQLNSAQLV